MDLSPNTAIEVPDHVLVRELDGQMVILNLETETYLGLDETGASFWAALTGTKTLAAACERLLAEYEVEESQLQQDLQELVRQMIDKGLVRIAG